MVKFVYWVILVTTVSVPLAAKFLKSTNMNVPAGIRTQSLGYAEVTPQITSAIFTVLLNQTYIYIQEVLTLTLNEFLFSITLTAKI